MEPQGLSGKTIAIYARFSTDKQSEASIDDQIRRCREWVNARGGEVTADRTYSDKAISGSSLARPAFEKMMQAVHEKRVQVIVVEDVSRVSRDIADGATLFRLLQFLGVTLIGVADGINSSEKSSKVTFAVKSLVSDIFLDDLRDKTLRGLEGRALAGYATGSVAFGFRTVPVPGVKDQVIGHRIEIHEERAQIVRRIFSLYLGGRSLSAIASLLNEEKVPPPRSSRRRDQSAWGASTLRWMVHNTAYIGRWSFKKKQWVKEPGTNVRRPRNRVKADVMESQREELRIIDDATWLAVQKRLAAVHHCYTRNKDGAPKGRAVPGKASNHLLSSLLRCGVCNAPMLVSAGSSAAYYRCGDHLKRGTCGNGLSVREDLAQMKILGTIESHLKSRDVQRVLKKFAAEGIKELEQTSTVDLVEKRKELVKLQAQVDRLVQFIADGSASPAVATRLTELEAQAAEHARAIIDLEQLAKNTATLQSPEEVLERAQGLEARLLEDVTAGRETLRLLCREGLIRLLPQPEGFYTAVCWVFPFALPLRTKKETPPKQLAGAASSSGCCGGRI